MVRALSLALPTFAAAQAGLFTASTHPHALQSSTRATIPARACSFRAFEAQLCNATSKSRSLSSYVQINEIYGAQGIVSVDVAAQRPRVAYNSYHGIVPGVTWEVARLGEESLRILLDEENDQLRFMFGESQWSEAEGEVEEGKGWCEVGDWSGGGAEGFDCSKGKHRTRRRILTCGFPCAPQEVLELR